jgi:hypothetical protein
MDLTSEELTLLREESQVWYPDLCNLYRGTPTTGGDDYGGYDPSPSEPGDLVQADIPCMVESGASHEQILILAGEARNFQIFRVHMSPTIDPHVDDHLIITTMGDQHLRVQAVLAPESYEIDRIVIGNELATH